MKQYIPKSAVVAEINRVLNSYDPNEITSGRYALVNLRNFLDTLEVKEVDFHKELLSFYRHTNDGGSNIALAKHFFELGLKAKKGE